MAVPYAVIDPTKPPVDPTQPQAWAYTPPKAGDLSANAMENHFSQINAAKNTASYAQMGAKVGSMIPVLGTLAGMGIGAAAGAIKGWAQGRTNDTKNEREQFAQSMGAKNTTDLWQKLSAALPADQAQELQSRALSRIGKHDTTANQQWEQDVQSALNAAGLQQSAQQQQAPAVAQGGGTATTPDRQAVLDALKGGGNYRDALVAYLAGRGR